MFRSVTDEMHRRSLESQEFGRRAARALGQVAQLEVCCCCFVVVVCCCCCLLLFVVVVVCCCFVVVVVCCCLLLFVVVVESRQGPWTSRSVGGFSTFVVVVVVRHLVSFFLG